MLRRRLAPPVLLALLAATLAAPAPATAAATEDDDDAGRCTPPPLPFACAGVFEDGCLAWLLVEFAAPECIPCDGLCPPYCIPSCGASAPAADPAVCIGDFALGGTECALDTWDAAGVGFFDCAAPHEDGYWIRVGDHLTTKCTIPWPILP